MSEPPGEDIFRSAPMVLAQLFVASEIGRDAVGALGQIGMVEFRNLNADKSSFQATFVDEIRRMDELSRLIGQLEKALNSSGFVPASLPNGVLHEPLMSAQDVIELGDRISTVAAKVGDLENSRAQLSEKCSSVLERRYVLRSADQFFGGRIPGTLPKNSRPDDVQPLLGSDARLEFDDEEELLGQRASSDGLMQLNASQGSIVAVFDIPLLAGTISRKIYGAFERLSWRTSRGNVYMVNFPINEPIQGELRDVFIAYTHGEATYDRIRRVAQSMDVKLVEVPHSAAERRTEVESANRQLNEVYAVLDGITRTLDLELQLLADQISVWKAHVAKERAVYQTLNMFNYDYGRRSLIGEAWIPKEDVHTVQATLQEITTRSGVHTPTVINQIMSNRTPPTFHRTNKITKAFQAIVDVYGVASYQEVNPGLPAIVTFPFMFAIMFGDVGHGIILSMAASVLVLREIKIGKMQRDEIFDMAYNGRYVLLFMGLFSIYTGFLYNDIFSKSMAIFKSGWMWPKPENGSTVTAHYTGHTYPFGLDWAWHGTDNNLLFTNSYKMKLSILVGYSHMTYSLFFQLANALFFHSWVDVVGNFIPGFLFMQSIFGYLSLTIIYKWLIDWIGKGWEPPGLLNMIINMFLAPGTIDVPLYRGQAFVQSILVLMAFVCVPWLLLFKPLYLRRKHKREGALGYSGIHEQVNEATFVLDDEEVEVGMVVQDVPEETEFEFSEILIHQVIHTIEFCLNCVSHTASYLRLWALSLAHNQLSTVLWDMTIRNAFGPTGVIGVITVVCLFAMWFVGTVVVLVCMEGTSAMLHSLRLHWVEAMSKHFEGEGYAFEPFSFKKLELS